MIKILSFVFLLIILSSATGQQQKGYGPQFLKEDSCLYAWVEDLTYHITLPNHPFLSGQAKIGLDSPYVAGEQKCSGKDQDGQLTLKFSNNTDSNIRSITIVMAITDGSRDWFIKSANAVLSITSEGLEKFKKNKFDFMVDDLYAAHKFSFSCSTLKLRSKPPADVKNVEPILEITLGRFQLQPFHEPPLSVFAPSFDCSVWLTLPALMGLAFMLFSIGVVLIGVYFLQDINTSDLKFSKQGGMLMNQAQLDATKG